MVGNRPSATASARSGFDSDQQQRPARDQSSQSLGSGLLGMLGSAIGSAIGAASTREHQPDGPNVRTFHFGGGSGAMVSGGSITFGGPSRLAGTRDEQGRVPLPQDPSEDAWDYQRAQPRNPFQQYGSPPQNPWEDDVETESRAPRMDGMYVHPLLAGLFGPGGIPMQPPSGDGDRSSNEHGDNGSRTGPRQFDTIEEMMQALMLHLVNPQVQDSPWFFRDSGLDSEQQGRFGDYVFTQDGFDRVMERMMEAAGQQNRPPPANQTVIEGLPRITVDAKNLSKLNATSVLSFIVTDRWNMYR